MDTQMDTLNRINIWLDRLEFHALELMECCQPDEFGPAQAATAAGKYITLIAHLLELRQRFSRDTSGDEEKLLKIIFAEEEDLLPRENPQ